jgi:uncharacterized protein
VIRAFLDANVLFTAAHNPAGKAALVIALGSRGHWQALTSAFAVEEARRNLLRKYPERLPDLERLLSCMPVPVAVNAARATDCALGLPEKDRPIFAAAQNVAATHLLTGDVRHFGPLMNRPDATGGIVIQRVAEFLAAALADE